MESYESGFFNIEREGGYTITNDNLITPYQYYLLGKNVLVCLDQNGIEKVQVSPPEGAVFVRRDNGEKYSKWLTFIVYGGKKYCNFSRPSQVRPNRYTVEFLPEKAVYTAVYNDFSVETEIFAALEKKDVVCSVKITNLTKKALKMNVYSQAYPFDNMPDVSAWDIPYWYLRTSVSHDEKKNLRFYSRLMNTKGEKEKRRNFCFAMSGEGVDSADYYMERYVGADDFYSPAALSGGKLAYDFMKNHAFYEMAEDNSIAGFQPVYCARYVFTIKPAAQKIVTQAFSFLRDNGGEISQEEEVGALREWFSTGKRQKEIARLSTYYETLFGMMRVKNPDGKFCAFVNSFLPLQLRWVGALDRGWASGMRGTRDCSNDYMALMYYEPEKAREILLHLFSCQRSDGWFPRQVGKSIKGPHDLRGYVDGGVFVIEFLYEYLCYTKDFALLEEKTAYLDCERAENLKTHVLKTLEYYMREENVGKDGLMKIREGDWFDGVNRAGTEGKGESVTVSCQFYMAVKYTSALFKKLYPEVDFSTCVRFAEKVKDAVNNCAFNPHGFYNGVKNDVGEWVFSDCDSDGKSRMFAVPNAFAVISGVAGEERTRSVLNNFARLKSKTGYKLFESPFETRIEHVGRVASGDVIGGLLGNQTVYNHGSQGFPARACFMARDAKKGNDFLSFSMPYDNRLHPESETLNPPYAVVNCYQDVAPCRHRVGFSFLTGTVAMIFRNIYSYAYGIRPCPEGLTIDPCLEKSMLPAEITYSYRGKKLRITYMECEETSGTICGAKLDYTTDVLTGRSVMWIREEQIKENTLINIMVGVK